MSRTGWKRAERSAAALLGGRRHPANVGGLVDCESEGVVAQVKERTRMSLHETESLALEIARVGFQKNKAGVLMIKRSAGKGRETPWLVVMVAEVYQYLNGPLPTGERSRP
jgi:hypothetical protein